MCVVQKGDNYYVVIRLDGRQKWVPAGKSKKQANALNLEMTYKASRDELVIPKPMLFKDFVDLWLQDYCAVTLKPGTVSDYTNTLKKHMVPLWGHIRMTAIRNDRVQRYISDLVSENRLKPKTIRNQIVALKRMYSVANQWGYATHNPAKNLALPRLQQVEIAYLTAPQMRQLIEATEDEWKALIACACLLGTRKMETAAITKECLLFKEHAIQIKGSLYNGKIAEPKTGNSVARLPMPAMLESLMRERTLMSAPNPENLVFCHKDGRPLRSEYITRNILNPALKKAGLPAVTFHGLRHSCIAAHIQAGTSLPVLQKLARHASIQTTIDRYGHLLPEATDDAVRRLEESVWEPRISVG